MVPDREAGCSLVESCPVEPVREFRRKHPGPRDRQLHQYVDRGEGGERHPLHVAQCREDRQLDSRRRSRFSSCRTSIWAITCKRQTGRENMKIWQGACIVHATFPARRVAEAKLEHPERQGGGASRVPANRCWRWRISSGPPRPSSTGAASSDADEFIVMTESGVNHSLQRAGARQEVLLRGQRELQLQRVPVHEAEHAREAARLPARPGAARGTVRQTSCAARWCRSSACWR